MLVMETSSELQFSEARRLIYKCDGIQPLIYGLPGQWQASPPKKLFPACLDLTVIQLISLLYGEGFHIFKPDVPVDHEDYDLKILMKHHQCVGPFPASYDEIANQERRAVLIWVMQKCPPDTMRPFHLTTSQEICNEDKEFLLKIMKLDPRDRPSAQELLEDSWFASQE